MGKKKNDDEMKTILDRIYDKDRPPHWMHWISVKDRLPSHETMVIVYSELCGIGLAFIDNRDEKWCGDCHDEDVLYWMPLPEPPEVEDVQG